MSQTNLLNLFAVDSVEHAGRTWGFLHGQAMEVDYVRVHELKAKAARAAGAEI